MIEIAGGRDLFAEAGDPSRRLDWETLAETEADPDLIVAMPCGFDQAGTTHELETLCKLPAWRSLRAVQNGRVYPVDANGCFSRPDPRLVDGIETLARCFHESGR